MSFPVPIEYALNDNKDNTIVKYDNDSEWVGLPDRGCFSSENINLFADRWLEGTLGDMVTLSSSISREYAFAGNPFKIVFYKGTSDIISNTFAYSRTFQDAIYVIPFSNLRGAQAFAYSYARTIDLGTDLIPNRAFYNSNVGQIILRNKKLVPLSNVNAFSSTKYQAGGSGGEIYIPKELYDHLGDGSELDYKAAENWSVIDGYGTITWRQIEGSEYEFNYADGTAIGSV